MISQLGQVECKTQTEIKMCVSNSIETTLICAKMWPTDNRKTKQLNPIIYFELHFIDILPCWKRSWQAVTSLTQSLFVCRVCTRAQRRAGRCTARLQIPTAGVSARWSLRHETSANETLGVDSYACWLNRCACVCLFVCIRLTLSASLHVPVVSIAMQRRGEAVYWNEIFTGLSLCFDTCWNTHEQTHTHSGFTDRCIPDTSVAVSSKDFQSFNMPKELKLKGNTDRWVGKKHFALFAGCSSVYEYLYISMSVGSYTCLHMCVFMWGYAYGCVSTFLPMRSICASQERNKSDLWQKLMNYWTPSDQQRFPEACTTAKLTHYDAIACVLAEVIAQ